MIEKLKYYRESRALTQKALSADTGISVRRISSYECEPVEPDIGTLKILADYFGITIDELIGRKLESPFSKDNKQGIDLSKIGPRIRQCRIDKSIKLKTVAKKIGISEPYLSVIETGGKIPSLETFISIICALEASADAILMDYLPSVTPKSNYIERLVSTLPQEYQDIALAIEESIVNTLRTQIDNSSKMKSANS